MEKRNQFVGGSYLTLDSAMDWLDRAQEASTVEEARERIGKAQDLLVALTKLRAEAQSEMESSTSD